MNMYRKLSILIIILTFSCTHVNHREEDTEKENKPEIIIKRRDDGTLSSINQVEDGGVVNGTRTTYYRDGKTVYSRLTFKHGIKHGISIRYYNNGQIYEHANYTDGKKSGLSRKYYKDGKLLSECEYEKGNPKPGLKEYHKDGSLVTSYPTVNFREINLLESKNRIDLEISCTKKSDGVKFYLLEHDGEETSRIYLITENGSASQRYYLRPGEKIDRKIELLVEIPTELGNTMVRTLTYQLSAEHL